MADAAPGRASRVRVRFAGQDVDGFVARAGRRRPSTRAGWTPLRRVVSAEPVLAPRWPRWPGASPPATPAPLRRAAARRAAPARAAEKAARRRPGHAPTAPARRRRGRGRGGDHDARAAAFLERAGRGRRGAARGAGRPLPGRRLADAARPRRPRRPRAARPRARWSCVPDARDVARSTPALTRRARAGPPRRADRRPRARRRATALPGRRAAAHVRVVVGTRAAVFAPVHDLGLVAIWDDGDDLHAEPRAPYPHAREVLLLRAEQAGRRGAGRRLRPQRRGGVPRRDRLGPRGRRHPRAVRAGPRSPSPVARDADRWPDPHARAARLPTQALRRCIRDGAAGRARCSCRSRAPATCPALACDRCRTPARCAACRGPLRVAGPTTPPTCRWCGRGAPGWACPECGGPRAARAGASAPRRTAEELGRAFPGVPVRHVRAATGARRRSPPSRRSWSPRPAPSRSPTAATPRRCCSTPGCCSAGPTCAPPRRRCAAGRRRGAGPPGGAAAAWSWSATRPSRRLQALVRWDPAGLRRARARRPASRAPAAGVAAGDAHRRPRRGGRRARLAGRFRRAPRCSVRCRSRRRAERRRSRSVVRVPARRRGRLSRAHCGELQRAAHRPASSPRVRVAGATRSALMTRRLTEPLASDQARPSSRESPRGRPADPAVRRPRAAHPAPPVTDFDKELRTLVKDLTDTMLEAPGAGLAAPQIGVGLRVFT